MHHLVKIIAMPCLVALSAHADWTLATYRVAAPDSASAQRIYGISTYSNAASATSVKVQDSVVRFHVDFASDTTAGFTANAGVVHNLSVPETAWDLSGLTRITFQFKSSEPIPGGLEVVLGSDAYTDRQREAGAVFKAVVRGASVATAQSDWFSVTLDIADFFVEGLDYNSRPRIGQILQKLTQVRISPLSTYKDSGWAGDKPCALCVRPTLASLELQLRRVTLQGITTDFRWPNPKGLGCVDGKQSIMLDNFKDGDTANEMGGYWYVSQDSGNINSATDLADPSKGSSRAQLAIEKSAGDDLGLLRFRARLDRRLGNERHANAGWAFLGTGFAGDGAPVGLYEIPEGTRPSQGLALAREQNLMMPIVHEPSVGIRFQMGTWQKMSAVEYVRVSIQQAGIPDSASFYALLAVKEMMEVGGRLACLRWEDFRQPSTVVSSQRGVLDPRRVSQFRWDLTLSGESGALVDTATTEIWLTDLKFPYGEATVVHPRDFHADNLSIQAGAGQLRLSGYQGFFALEVVSLQGRTLATFAPQASVALSLPRGTYHLVGRRDGVRVSKAFSVVR